MQFEKNGTSSVVLLYIILSNLSAGIFFPIIMTPVHSGQFHKGEKWNFYFNNILFLTDIKITFLVLT